MRFCDFAKMMKTNYPEKLNVAEFVKTLIDLMIEDAFIECKKEANPLYALKESTLEACYSGRLNISAKNASVIRSHKDEAKFADAVCGQYSYDALVDLADKLGEYGFGVSTDEVARACANILAQIIGKLADRQDARVTSLNFNRRETGQKLKNITPTSIERRGDKLVISGETIPIDQKLVPAASALEELRYVKALCDAYAEKLERQTLEEKDIPSLSRQYSENFKEQRKAYYSATSIWYSIRDVYADGEDEFIKLKEDAWHGINDTYWKEYKNGYERLIAVLEKVTSTTLDASILYQMRNLIRNLEKKGICHILVNEGTIESWVTHDEQ